MDDSERLADLQRRLQALAVMLDPRWDGRPIQPADLRDWLRKAGLWHDPEPQPDADLAEPD